MSLLILACGLLVFAQTAQALTVKNVRLGVHPDKTRIVLDLDEKTDYRTFILSDPWRLVIDLPQFDWTVGNITTPRHASISGLRKGAFNDAVSRIVLDLKSPARIKTAFFLPAASGKSDRLVIDLASASVQNAMARKSKIFGALSAPASPSAEKDSRSVTPRQSARERNRRNATEESRRDETQTQQAAALTVPPRKPSAIVNYEKPVIIIDAGHGGADPGAISTDGSYEKHITLAMARRLKDALDATNLYTVKLTRTSDKYLRLHQRVSYARKNDGDLFISLHADSIGKKNVRGASVYTLSEKASDEQTAKLAVRENRADLIAGIDLSAEDEVVVNILVDLAMRDTMNQSKFMANTLVNGFQGNNIRMLENPHRYAGFAVLKAPDIPSILIEMGFLSNSSEARLLKTPAFQKKLARALVASINAYFAKVRENERS